MSEQVPEGWKRVRLGDVGKISTSSVDKKIDDTETPAILLNYMDVYNKSFLNIWHPYQKITANKKQLTTSEVRNGDVFFTPSSETPDDIGHSAVFLGEAKNLVHSYHTVRFRCARDNLFFDLYKGYAFKSEATYEYFRKAATGSTRFTLSLPVFQDLEVFAPPLPEQQKIAAILTSVDEVIEKTQSQINKLQDLKKATMNELLSKGIGHTEFKDSELGRIPKSWDTPLLDKVSKRGSGHTPSKDKSEYWDGGVLWVSLSDSHLLDNGYIHKTSKIISELGIKSSSAVLHPAGTVIMTRDAGVGKSAILATKMAVSQHFISWFCDEKIDNWYLYYFLQKMKPVFENIAMGSTIKTIGLPYFKKLRIPCPPISEQRAIRNHLLSIDQNIAQKSVHLGKLKTLKKALMQDLLTGKVRVKVA
jgi:type I restriction enzyme S subunit